MPCGEGECSFSGDLAALLHRSHSREKRSTLFSGLNETEGFLFVFPRVLLFAELPGAPSNLVISNISPRSVTISFRPGTDGKTAKSQWVVEGQVCVCGGSVRPSVRPSVPSVPFSRPSPPKIASESLRPCIRNAILIMNSGPLVSRAGTSSERPTRPKRKK